MSVHSRTQRPEARAGRRGPHALALAAALCALLGTASASAQTRTPTSPLDRSTPMPDAPITTSPAPWPTREEHSDARPAPTQELAVPVAATGQEVDLVTLFSDKLRSPGGLSAEAAAARAAKVSLTVQRAALSSEAAHAGLRQTRRGFVPSARVSARYSRLSDLTPGTIQSFDTPACLADLADCQAMPSSYVRNAVLQQPILDQYALRASLGSRLTDLVGTQRHQLRAAQRDVVAAREQARADRDDVYVQALEAYWEVVRARAQLVLAHDVSTLAQRRADEAAQRATQGVITSADRLAAEAHARSYRQLEDVAESRVELAEAVLRDLLRIDPREPLVLDIQLDTLPVQPGSDSGEARRAARDSSPSARAALARADAADARADAQRSQLLPALSVSFNVETANPNQRIFPQTTDFTTTWDAGVELSWAFDAALVSQARLQQQRALAEDQRLLAEEVSEAAEREALRARNELLTALSNVDVLKAAAGVAGERLRVTAERRDAGVGTDTDLLDAEAQNLRATLELVDAVVDAQLADARLRRARGDQPMTHRTVKEH